MVCRGDPKGTGQQAQKSGRARETQDRPFVEAAGRWNERRETSESARARGVGKVRSDSLAGPLLEVDSGRSGLCQREGGDDHGEEGESHGLGAWFELEAL